MTVREIEWPGDVGAVARALARAAASPGSSGAWFWLDGEAPEPGGAKGHSYLGLAAEVRHAERGCEHEFLTELRGTGLRDTGLHGTTHRAASHDALTPESAWIIALSYEFGVALMGELPAEDAASPGFALRADTVLQLDHARGVAELHGPSEEALDRWVAGFLPGAAAPGDRPAPPSPPTPTLKPTSTLTSAPPSAVPSSPAWRRSEAEYLGQLGACLEAIRDGEAYVLCLTDTVEVAALHADPLDLYLRLRQSGTALRGGVMVAGHRALVSASPERFLSVRGRAISTHPIKGTRPRGTVPAQDEILAEELAADPKERAENLMIVDLMRNDLSRVCEPGTVAATGFLRVETHPRVHQLVSTVTGQLADHADVFDAIRACFPGGSMTGAPKRRAVQLLAELEGAPRGLYSGCFGWVAPGGDAELAMTIRGIELRGIGTETAHARIGAGGGVTADSDPAAEYAEKALKAQALLDAL